MHKVNWAKTEKIPLFILWLPSDKYKGQRLKATSWKVTYSVLNVTEEK